MENRIIISARRRAWLALRPPVEYRRFITEKGTVAAPGVYIHAPTGPRHVENPEIEASGRGWS